VSLDTLWLPFGYFVLRPFALKFRNRRGYHPHLQVFIFRRVVARSSLTVGTKPGHLLGRLCYCSLTNGIGGMDVSGGFRLISRRAINDLTCRFLNVGVTGS